MASPAAAPATAPPDLGPPATLVATVPAWESTLPVEDYPFHQLTLEVLEEVHRLGVAVRVHAFFRPPEPGWVEPGGVERARVAMARLLAGAAHRVPEISVEVHDWRSPWARAHGVAENGVYVLEALSHRATILADDLEYLYTLPPRPGLPPGMVERVALFRGEEALASALRELLEGAPSAVCFTTGHGEADPVSAEPAGYARASEALGRLGRSVERWVVDPDAATPDRCGVVAMVGPRQELDPATQAWLVRHLGARRPFVLLLDAGAPAEGLGSVLRPYGLELIDNSLIEPDAAFRSPSDPRVALPDLNGHFVTTQLMDRRQLVGLEEVRGIRYGQWAQVAADVRTILQSSNRAWGETQRGPAPRFQEEDLRPPVSAAVAVSSTLGANDALQLKVPGELRLAVVGDADFASNAGLERADGNLEFFLRLVRWVSREAPRVTIPPLPVQQILR